MSLSVVGLLFSFVGLAVSCINGSATGAAQVVTAPHASRDSGVTLRVGTATTQPAAGAGKLDRLVILPELGKTARLAMKFPLP